MLTSFFENNKELRQITVYLMTSDMTEKNMDCFFRLVSEYGRTIKIIDTAKIDDFLEKNCVPRYKNAYSAYYKIFALSIIKDTIDRLVYIDADTIVNGSLTDLLDYDLRGNAVGMSLRRLKC